MIHLDDEAVRAALRWDALIAAMERALSEFSSGHVVQPLRNWLTVEEGNRFLGVMPAATRDAMGVKLVSFYPCNAGTPVPTVMRRVYRRSSFSFPINARIALPRCDSSFLRSSGSSAPVRPVASSRKCGS